MSTCFVEIEFIVNSIQQNQFKKLENHILASKFLIVLSCLVLIIFWGFCLSFIPGVRNSITLATTVKPEPFTELYFEDHSDLPKVNQINKVYSFKFTVHNLEYKNMNYPYEVYMKVNGYKIPIDSGNFTLKQDEYKTLKEEIASQVQLQNTKVVVNLVNKNQQIDFWMEVKK